MASTATLNRNQNTYTVNAHLSDEVLFVNPEIASDVEEVEMNIAEDGMDFIFDMLSDLSANRGAYAIREAYSNAYDATVVGGDMTRPIEITLYSEEAEDSLAKSVAEKSGMLGAFPMFASITDHGCGMSTDDVKQYFTQYGGSNKRDGKNTIGSKGLGSKAPLACADLFTVESTKDGITTTATIERKQGRNCATVRAEETGKGSGTTITIPLTDMKTYSQMHECVRDIVKWNLDATIIFNGEETTPSFIESTLGSSLVGTRKSSGIVDYIYLGNIPVAVDEEGNEISFRMWQRANIFPSKKCDAIDLNLAGVRYELRGVWSNEFPSLIVAGEPGFLNFTPSRDEIKDDEAKASFVEAIEGTLADYDFTDTVSCVLSDMSLYDMRSWLFTRSDTINFTADGKGNVNVNMTSQGISYTVPESAFIKDGVDYSSLFGFGDDSDLATAKVMASSVGWHDRIDFDVAKRDPWNDDLPKLVDCSKKDAAMCTLESFSMGELFRTVLKSKTFDTIFAITGTSEGDQKRFINNEKTIRDAYGCKGSTLYVFCDVGEELSDMDKAALDARTVTYVTFAEMLAASREYRRNARAGADSANFTEKMIERYGSTIQCFDLTADYDLDCDFRYVANCEHGRFDYAACPSFEKLAEKNIIMLTEAGNRDNMTEIGAAVTIASAMVKNGTLDKKFESFLVMPKMNANDIKAFIKAGGKFWADVRKNPSASITETIAGDTEGINAVAEVTWRGRREFRYYELDPKLVMSAEAARELDSANPTYWHIAKDMKQAARVKAIMELLPESCAAYKGAEPVCAKVLTERGDRWRTANSTITFKAEPEAANIEMCESYDKLAKAIDEAFCEISLDNFFETRYNDEKEEREIRFYKNAEAMLAPMVNEIAEKHLA